jgi:hypothetical protein
VIYVPDTVGDGAFVLTAFDLTAKAKRAFRRRQPTSLANPLAIKLDHCPSAWNGHHLETGYRRSRSLRKRRL